MPARRAGGGAFLIHSRAVEKPIFGEDVLVLLSCLGFFNPSPAPMQNLNTPLKYYIGRRQA